MKARKELLARLRNPVWTGQPGCLALDGTGTIADMAKAADDIELLQDALKAAERADKRANNCEEHEPEMAPESCGKCFPLADDARTKRWAALGINQIKE